MNGDILPIEVMARRENWSDGISIYIRQVIVGNGFRYAEPVVLKDGVLGAMVDPAMILPIQTAQQLMDELWQCGLRPSEGTGSAGALAATQRHLDDMRAIVFKTTPKPGAKA